jgi:epoxyqueuosine reductase QueG
MKQQELKDLVCAEVREAASTPDGETQYREPIIGFSGVDPEEFDRLKQTVPEHLMPEELLPGARGLVSYFLPFSVDVVRANARAAYVAREWAVAYVETNSLLAAIGERLVAVLARQGVRAVAEAPTHVFDKGRLRARWSHKSIAYMTGIGSFGLNQLLITDAGCAGRFGSIVVDHALDIRSAPRQERCLYFHSGTCGRCVQRCPVGALGLDGSFDRIVCYQHLQEADAYFADLLVTDVCGQCSVSLPCSLENPVPFVGSGRSWTCECHRQKPVA